MIQKELADTISALFTELLSAKEEMAEAKARYSSPNIPISVQSEILGEMDDIAQRINDIKHQLASMGICI